MAAVKGDVGKIMFHNAAGTEADIGGLRSWELNITKDTQETTVMGNTSKTFVGGLISGEGSATLIYDNAGNSDYLAFVEDVLTTGDAADALFELFPDSSASSKKLAFSFGRRATNAIDIRGRSIALWVSPFASLASQLDI